MAVPVHAPQTYCACNSTGHNSEVLSKVSTPLNMEAWAKALATHPDQAFARYICEGLKSGFRIGFRHGSPLKSAATNMPSAQHHPEVVQSYMCVPPGGAL